MASNQMSVEEMLENQKLSESAQQIQEAATKGWWHLVLQLLPEYVELMETETLKDVLLKIAYNHAWWVLLKLFESDFGLGKIIYKCFSESLSKKQQEQFFDAVYKHSASLGGNLWTSANVFLCIIFEDLTDWSIIIAKEIVVHVGKRIKKGVCRYHNLYKFFEMVDYPFFITFSEEFQIFLLTTLVNDGRNACVYLAILLSASSQKWDFVTKSIASAALRFTAGAKFVFRLAWDSGYLEIAARVLEKTAMISELGEWDTCLCVIQRRKPCPCVESLVCPRSYDKQKVADFLDICQKLHLQEAAMTMYLWVKDVNSVRKLWPLVESRHRKWSKEAAWNSNVLMGVVLQWCGLRSAIELLPHCEDENAFVTELLARWMDSGFNDGPLWPVMRQIVSKCQKRSSLDTVVHYIIMKLQSPELFGKLLATDFHPSKFHVDIELLDFLISIINDRNEVTADYVHFVPYQNIPRINAAREMLRHCLETGITTYVATHCRSFSAPMSIAVHGGLLDVAELLYNTGATTNREMHNLKINDGLWRHRDPKKRSDLFHFVAHVASNPRTLRDLCRLKVSDLLGSQTDRKQKALTLNLPLILTNQILLYDVLYTNGIPWPQEPVDFFVI